MVWSCEKGEKREREEEGSLNPRRNEPKVDGARGWERGGLRSVTGELSEARLRTLSRRVDAKAAVCPFPKRFFGVAGLQQIVARKIK